MKEWKRLPAFGGPSVYKTFGRSYDKIYRRSGLRPLVLGGEKHRLALTNLESLLRHLPVSDTDVLN